MILYNFDDFLIKFKELLQNSNSCIITSHSNTDLDGFGSAIALSKYISFENQNLEVGAIFSELNQSVKNFIKRNQNVENYFQIKQSVEFLPDLIIIVDNSDINRTVFSKSHEINEICSKSKIISIDHHKISTSSKNNLTLSLQQPDKSSTAEIISSFLLNIDDLNNEIPWELLMLGIITDTAHFRYATASTFEIYGKIMMKGNYSNIEMYNSLSISPSLSERIAILKGFARIQKIHNIHGNLIVISHLSSFEAIAAKKMINLGADASFIINFTTNQGDFRISSRLSQNFASNPNFQLGNFMDIIGKNYEGSGGGHDGAAGCYGKIKNFNTQEKQKYIHLISKSILDEFNQILSKEVEQI